MAVTRYASMLAMAVLWAGCSREQHTLSVGQPIHYDDFDYTVEAVDRTSRIANRKANGMFYVVTFRVDNHAKRVDHQWSNEIAYIVDEQGHAYDNRRDVQQTVVALKGFMDKDRYVTPAGATDRTLLVFDIPTVVSQPYLKVRGSLLMGDLFDLDLYARTQIRLF